jgi:nucleotide-binding universal stress UspA family protein
MKLLLAVDSVTTLDILLAEVLSRSWPSGTEARVLSIVEDGEVPLQTWQKEGYGADAVRHEMRRRAEQVSALAVERLEGASIQTQVSIMRGSPGFLIPFAARKWSTDLIFIRAHNRKDFRNWMLGSVSKVVIDSAPCSVEVIRTSHDSHSINVPQGKRILLATDGSDSSLAAAQAVVEETWPEDTEVKVVSVVDPLIYSLEEMGLRRDRATKRAHIAIGDAFRPLKKASLKITGEVIAGRVARAIINRALSWGADLVVVGTQDQRRLKRLLFRSPSAAIARQAHCSVRIIRGRTISRNRNVVPRALRKTSSTPRKASWLAGDFASRRAA